MRSTKPTHVHDTLNLVLNYSRPATALVAEDRIDIAYFKCPDWPDMVAEARRYRPVAVHFSLRAGTSRLHETDWALIELLMQLTGTPYVNLHLCPTSKYNKSPSYPPL